MTTKRIQLATLRDGSSYWLLYTKWLAVKTYTHNSNNRLNIDDSWREREKEREREIEREDRQIDRYAEIIINEKVINLRRRNIGGFQKW